MHKERKHYRRQEFKSVWASQGRLSRNEDSELGVFSKMDRSLSRGVGIRTQKLKTEWCIQRTNREKAPEAVWLC